MESKGQCCWRPSLRCPAAATFLLACGFVAGGCTYWIQGGITTSGGGFKGQDVQGRSWAIESLPTSQPVQVKIETTVKEPNTPPE